jgi:hypothetical protein
MEPKEVWICLSIVENRAEGGRGRDKVIPW